MSSELVPIPSRDLARAGLDRLPAAIGRAGEAAAWRFIEFFVATIRNKNTRAAYAEAVGQFFTWCELHRVRTLEQISPIVIAAYIENHPGAAPTIKQHLAAIRMLFDFLVTGQIVPMNPASSVRGPKHVVKRGKTPVLKADQARTLLDSIKLDSVIGLRDRADK
jgi:site-specific recombinase XerD